MNVQTIAGKPLNPRTLTRGYDPIHIGYVYDWEKGSKVQVYCSVQRKAPYQFCAAKLCYYDKETWTIAFFAEWKGRNKETNRPYEHRLFINPDVQSLTLDRENMVIEGTFGEVEEVLDGVIKLYEECNRVDLGYY